MGVTPEVGMWVSPPCSRTHQQCSPCNDWTPTNLDDPLLHGTCPAPNNVQKKLALRLKSFCWLMFYHAWILLGQKDLNKIESGSIQGSSSKPFARPEETSSEHLLRCPSSTKAGMRATYAHKGLPGWSLAFALNVARYHKSDVLLHKPTELLPDIIAHRPDASSTQSVVWSAHLSAIGGFSPFHAWNHQPGEYVTWLFSRLHFPLYWILYYGISSRLFFET